MGRSAAGSPPGEEGCEYGRPDLKSEPATSMATRQVPGGGRRPGPAPGRHSQSRECLGSAKQAPPPPGSRTPANTEHLRPCWGQDRLPERTLRKRQVGPARVCLWRPSTLRRKPVLWFSGAQRPVSLKPQAWVPVHKPWGSRLFTTSSTPCPTAGQPPRPRPSGSPRPSVLTESLTCHWAAPQNMPSHPPLDHGAFGLS